MAVLLLSGVAAYANSLDAPWVFDGKDYIAGGRASLKLWPPWASMQGAARPIGTWSFAVSHALHGTDVFGYHVLNLAIHLGAALALLGIVRRTLLGTRLAERYAPAATGLALAVAMLWMLHPLQTQSVTYVYQRFESLMGLFFLLTLYTFIRAQDAARPVWWYAGSIGCCLLAMGSKEVAAVLPLVLLWYDRALLADSWREVFRRRWKFYATLFGLLGVLGLMVLTRLNIYRGGGVLVVEGLSWWEYALTQPGVVLHYLRLSFWPQGQCLDYAWPVAQGPGAIVPPLLAVGALLALTGWLVVRRPALGFLGGWFFLILAPTSSVAPIKDLAFEHRMYLSLAAVVAAVVIGGYELLGRVQARRPDWPSRRTLGIALVAVAAIALGTATWFRNETYASEVSVWRDVVAKCPNNARAHNSLGSALAAEGKVEPAIGHFRKALELDADYGLAHFNLATVLGPTHPHEAVEHYHAAIEQRPRDARAYANLGAVLTQLKEMDAAERHLRKAIELQPRAARAHFNLANVLARQSRLDEAIEHYREALRIEPDYSQAAANLELALQLRAEQPGR